MTRELKLLPRAERSLNDISQWTEERFGPEQATTYIARIRARLHDVQFGTAHLRRLDKITGNPRHSDAWAVRAGEHFLILSLSADQIIVLDVRHTRSDPGNFLEIPDLKD